MKVAFLAGPYRGDFQERCRNIIAAKKVAKKYWAQGFAVICPHMNSSGFDGIERVCPTKFTEGYLEILRRCDTIIIMSTWHGSAGATAELHKAQELDLEIIYDEDDE